MCVYVHKRAYCEKLWEKKRNCTEVLKGYFDVLVKSGFPEVKPLGSKYEVIKPHIKSFVYKEICKYRKFGTSLLPQKSIIVKKNYKIKVLVASDKSDRTDTT